MKRYILGIFTLQLIVLTSGCINNSTNEVGYGGCIDSDNGDYFTMGVTQTETRNQTDYCGGPINWMEEYFCDSKGRISLTVVKCEYGCLDGACLRENKMSFCEDTDGGFVIEEMGNITYVFDGVTYTLQDYCVDRYGLHSIVEYVCGENIPDFYDVYYAWGTCENGSYVPYKYTAEYNNPDCIDTDNGSYYKKGKTDKGTIRSLSREDECRGNMLTEYQCTEDNYYVYAEHYQCPGECEDGACVPET